MKILIASAYVICLKLSTSMFIISSWFSAILEIMFEIKSNYEDPRLDNETNDFTSGMSNKSIFDSKDSFWLSRRSTKFHADY